MPFPFWMTQEQLLAESMVDEPDGDEKVIDNDVGVGDAQGVQTTVNLVSYDFGEQITIVDGINEPLAHGCILDDEPDVHLHGMEERWQKPGWWKKIQITTILPKCRSVTIDADHVYYADGDKITTKHDRTLKALMDVVYTSTTVGEEPHPDHEGFIIFHQWIVPRMRGAKRTQAPQGTSVKTGKKQKYPPHRPLKKRRR